MSEVRQPGGLDGRRKKLDAEDYIVSREHKGQIIKIHFDENVADQTKRNVKAKILQNNIGKLTVDTKREYDLETAFWDRILVHFGSHFSTFQIAF